MKKHEQRGLQGIEIRSDDGEGFFSGYIAVWGTTDSYNSTFIRGAFKKTIEERGTRIKVLDDHGKIIGKVTEIREDTKGVYVEGALTMAVERARDVYEHMRAKAIDTLSFGFKTVRDKYVSGVRNITEVKLFEVSPVTFEANEAAMIENVRAEDEEKRSTDFSETERLQALSRGGWTLTDALYTTLQDIWWDNNDPDTVRAQMDEALAKFHAAYLTWVNEYLTEYWDDSEQRTKPGTNEVRTAFESFADGRSLDEIAAETTFTVDELRSLEQGKILDPASGSKIDSMPDDFRTAYHAERRSRVEALCSEIRTGGFSAPEGERFTALLFSAPVTEERSEETGLGDALAGASKLLTI